MVKLMIFVLLFVTLIDLSAQSQPRFEIGVIVGQPTGLSAKYWTGPRSAFDAAAAWSFGDNVSLEIHADILYHPYYFRFDQGVLPIYIGAGPVIYLREETVIGTRFPIGVTYVFNDLPLSFFLEIAPLVEILPETDFTANGGVGIRLVF